MLVCFVFLLQFFDYTGSFLPLAMSKKVMLQSYEKIYILEHTYVNELMNTLLASRLKLLCNRIFFRDRGKGGAGRAIALPL